MKDKSSTQKKKNRKMFRRVVLVAVIFSAWILVSEHNSGFLSTSPFTGSNLHFILMDFLNFIANLLKNVILAIGFVINGINNNPENLTYLASPISALGIIPVYSLAKGKGDSRGGPFFISLLYLFFSLLISPSWFSLIYLSLFPTLFLYGLALHRRKRRISSFLFMFAAMFVAPISAVAVFIFSITVFYRSWNNGKEGFLKNSYSMILEGISGFIVVDFFLKYTFMFFLDPFRVRTIDVMYASTYYHVFGNQLLTYEFTNILPILPEFTSKVNLEFSLVVIAVIVVIFGLAKAVSSRVAEGAEDA